MKTEDTIRKELEAARKVDCHGNAECEAQREAFIWALEWVLESEQEKPDFRGGMGWTDWKKADA